MRVRCCNGPDVHCSFVRLPHYPRRSHDAACR
jgi:hypothetical protein